MLYKFSRFIQNILRYKYLIYLIWALKPQRDIFYQLLKIKNELTLSFINLFILENQNILITQIKY